MRFLRLSAAVLLTAPMAACSRAPGGGRPEAEGPQQVARPGHVGTEACAKCHAIEAQKFAQSDHARAQALPTAQTVKGNFEGASFEHLGVVSRFEREGAKYFITTEGADGKPARFEVAYVFGHFPLQQYLVKFPGGRLQCLPLAYDTRPKAQGGQRWFHLYGDEKIAHDDPLHWTGPMQNWNHMCASCHTTALEKGYDEKTDTFKTTFAEPTISCESCHGPGEAHAKNPAVKFAPSIVDKNRLWVMDMATGIAKRSGGPPPAALVDSCARCHARAEVLDEKAHPAAPLDQARRPSLLEQGLYHGTGEIQDEVYEWGSFAQSKMAHAGVTCADCHDPHSGKRLQTGNALCAQCHLPAKFDVPAHHQHKAGGAGAQCVACHMPTHTYMGVDVRRDHGFRVPRPDLTVKWGEKEAPNACAACHAKEGAKWAADQVAKWPNHKADRASFADALCAGRAGAPGARSLLEELVLGGSEPAIARATALRIWDSPTEPAVRAGLNDPDPLVRAAAVAVMDGINPEGAQLHGVDQKLSDPSKVVRLAAVRALAPIADQLPAADRAAFDKAWAEAQAAEEVNADRAEAQTNLGILAMARGDAAGAESRFAKAIARNPTLVPAWANLADLARARGEPACEKVLREALDKVWDKAAIRHALGLSLIRQKRTAEAEAQFAQAAKARPEVPTYALFLGLAQDALGKGDEALATVRLARLRHPNDRSLLQVLAELAEKAGKTDEAQAARGLLMKWE